MSEARAQWSDDYIPQHYPLWLVVDGVTEDRARQRDADLQELATLTGMDVSVRSPLTTRQGHDAVLRTLRGLGLRDSALPLTPHGDLYLHEPHMSALLDKVRRHGGHATVERILELVISIQQVPESTVVGLIIGWRRCDGAPVLAPHGFSAPRVFTPAAFGYCEDVAVRCVASDPEKDDDDLSTIAGVIQEGLEDISMALRGLAAERW